MKNEFEKIDWLIVSNRVDQCLAVTAYNFKNALSSKCMSDIYSLRISPNITTSPSANSFKCALKMHFYESSLNI